MVDECTFVSTARAHCGRIGFVATMLVMVVAVVFDDPWQDEMMPLCVTLPENTQPTTLRFVDPHDATPMPARTVENVHLFIVRNYVNYHSISNVPCSIAPDDALIMFLSRTSMHLFVKLIFN